MMHEASIPPFAAAASPAANACRERRAQVWAAPLLCAGLLLTAFPVRTIADTTEKSPPTVEFKIPAGALADALLQFSEASGQRLLINADLLRGLVSPGLQGTMTPSQALQRLLAGSGLTVRRTESGSLTLEKAAAASPQSAASVLPGVTVTGRAEYADTDPYNPHYNRSVASTATKTDTPVMETPVSIQVVPKAVLQDQQAIRVGDALRNVSGYFDTRGEEFFYDTAFLRGFDTGSSQYIDGLRDVSQSHSLANIEQVEVLKGPAGALYGRLQPGGLINYVTKRPLDTPYYSVQQQFGSFDLYRTLVDATGPVNQDGSLRYRFNMEYLDSNSFRDVVHKERGFVAPSLAWILSPRTRLDFDFRYHDVNGPTTFGVPAVGKRPANVPISRYFGEPALDGADFSLLYGGMSLSHEFNERWKLEAKAAYNSNHQYSAGVGIEALDETSGEASRWYSMYDYDQDSIQGLINLTGKFSLLATEHTLAVGGDIFKIDYRNNTALFLCEVGCGNTFPARINIYQPMVYGRPGVDLSQEQYDPTSSGRDSWWGLYIQDQVKIREDWHVLFGTRYDQARTSWVDTPTTDDGEFSPRVGLLYRPLQWLSLYGNYSKALNAANSVLVAPGTQRKPEMSEGYEAGLKGEWWDGRLNASLAFFELTKKNVAQTDPDDQRYSIFVGKGRSRGIEFDMAGRVTEQWNLIATYSYTDTRVVEDADFRDKRFINVPRHAGSLWSKYEFAEPALKGLWSGAGVYLVGQREGDNLNSFQLPGYARVDAALGYAFHAGPSKISLQFNIDNLLDKRYYTNSTWGSRTGGIQPGASRTFLGSVRIEF
ncbi:TonB-dependent siderophore receptor [Methylomonas sp. HW2-6]|uniref:TonB-dependent siderophore receptor n=1 Tax=Methylomonas sp. HW2-6 TaxID=3376687 RepID=UPI004042DF48